MGSDYRYGHRWTFWHDQAGHCVQVSVACCDDVGELVVEVTESVGPFDELEEVQERALSIAHGLGGWRAHQQALQL